MTDSTLLTPSTVMFPEQDSAFVGWHAAYAAGGMALRYDAQATGLVQSHGGPVFATWRGCIESGQDKRVVVVRALDTEPGVHVRSALVSRSPVTLIEGACIAAVAIGASSVVVVVGSDANTDGLDDAISVLRTLAGNNSPEIEIHRVDPLFMDADDLALVRRLDGKPAMSALTPPTVEQRGLGGNPTVVHSAETVCNLVAIARGARPVQLWQVDGDVVRVGLVETGSPLTLRLLIDEHCGGIAEGASFSFALVGGVSGELLTEADLDREIHQTGLGVPHIRIAGAGTCAVETVRAAAEHLTRNNCGRCVACREGSFQLSAILGDLTRGRSQNQDEEQLREIAAAMQAGSLCAAGIGGARPVLGLLTQLRTDYDAHRRKTCPALACNSYVTFHILGELCTGCGKCVDPCPEDAIDGDDDLIHVIDANACTSCGICLPLCPDKAIVKAGQRKPKTPKSPVPVGSWKKR